MVVAIAAQHRETRWEAASPLCEDYPLHSPVRNSGLGGRHNGQRAHQDAYVLRATLTGHQHIGRSSMRRPRSCRVCPPPPKFLEEIHSTVYRHGRELREKRGEQFTDGTMLRLKHQAGFPREVTGLFGQRQIREENGWGRPALSGGMARQGTGRHHVMADTSAYWTRLFR